MAELTRKVVKVLIDKFPDSLSCTEIGSALRMNSRRVYDVVDCLYVLGFVKLTPKGHPVWTNQKSYTCTVVARPNIKHKNARLTIGQATEKVVAFFANQPPHNSQHVWQGKTVQKSVDLGTRKRLLYDVLAVFYGIGLISVANVHHPCHFVWTPQNAPNLKVTIHENKQEIQLPSLREELLMSSDTSSLFEHILGGGQDQLEVEVLGAWAFE